MKKLLIPAVLCILSSGLLCAQDNFVKLPDGTVLQNPYILNQTPSTVTIGHAYGCFQVAIKDLPPEYQKFLNYDAAKAAKYEEAKAKRKAESESKQKEQTAKENKARAEADRKAEIKKLESRINELKIRIASDEKNLANLEKVFISDKDSANQLSAIQPVSTGSCSASWGRWGIRRYRVRRGGRDRAANRAARDRGRQIRRLNKEADQVGKEYCDLDRKIQEQKIELGEKEARLSSLLNSTK